MFHIIIKMDFVVLLSVLAITQTIVLARPSGTDDQTKRFLFPTQLRHGCNVTINGTMATTQHNNNILEVVFPSISGEEKKHCKLKYHINENKVNISPAEGDNEIESTNYDFYGNLTDPSNPPTFSIVLKILEDNRFKLSFEVNRAGEIDIGYCLIDSYDNITHMEFRQGLLTLTSLLVEFL